MGISIIDNFDYRAGKPNFTRDLFENIEEMVSFSEMYLPDVFEANVKSGDRYRFNRNNEVDPILGKWRLVSAGSSGPVSGYTKDEINAKMNLKLDKPEIDGTEGQFLSLDVDGKTVFVDLPQYDDTEIKEMINNIERGNLSYEIVTQLPDPLLQTIEPDMVYMIPASGDVYNMFLFVEDKFVSLGSTGSGGVTGPIISEDVAYSNTTIDSVTDVKGALDALISKVYYVAPKINSFTCSPNQLSYEIGQKVSSVVFNWSYNKDIAYQTLTDCDVSDITVRTATYDNEITTNKTFTLSCGDGQNSASSSKSFTFSSRIHSGSASIPASYNSEFILSLPGQLKGNKSGTYTVNVGANQYFYIAMPTSYNSGDTLVGKIGGFSTTFGKVAQLSHTNASGYTCDYNIYKSTNANLGNVSFVV
jgi:hypothetical protein